MNTAKYFEKKDNQDNVVWFTLCILMKLYVKVVLGVAIQNNIIVIFTNVELTLMYLVMLNSEDNT